MAIFSYFRHFSLFFDHFRTEIQKSGHEIVPKKYFRVENLHKKSKKSSFVGEKLITFFWSKLHAVGGEAGLAQH